MPGCAHGPGSTHSRGAEWEGTLGLPKLISPCTAALVSLQETETTPKRRKVPQEHLQGLEGEETRRKIPPLVPHQILAGWG